MDEETKYIGVRIPISLYQKLKAIAHEKQTTLTEIAILSFTQYTSNTTPGLCSSCHHQNSPDAKFCQNCGDPLTEETAASLKQEIVNVNQKMERIIDATLILEGLKQELESKGVIESESQWLNTSRKDIRLRIASPIDKAVVKKETIDCYGQTMGLKDPEKYYIRGYISTNKEYEQSASSIDEQGYWKISPMHLGAFEHKLYFRLFDEANRLIAESESITIYRKS